MKSFLFSLLCLSLGSLAHAEPMPPNLIVILADDLGWKDLGCYGNTFNETPNIDRLAREGMRFTQYYAGPVCSPTRANLQTGRDQARYGITQHIPGHRRPYAKLTDPIVESQLPLEVETYAERLRTCGYATGYFGKWHLGKEGYGPGDQGWETFVECTGHTQPATVTGTGSEQRTAEFLTDRAEAFIQKNKDRPFVLQISHYAVHISLSTTPELRTKYEAKPPMPGYPSHPLYAGLLEELDRGVGRVMDAVDRAGLGDRTLIWFLSDNGGLVHTQDGQVITNNAPLRGEKGTLYEGGIRIPSIARWTGRVPANSECTTPATTHDIHPTLVELGCVTSKSTQELDGISLAALLRNPKARIARDSLYWHLPHYHHSTPASAIRRGEWKLIQFYESDSTELYNLSDDLSESQNVADAQPEISQRLKTALAEWRGKVNARMPVPNPDHDPVKAQQLGHKDEQAKSAKARRKKTAPE